MDFQLTGQQRRMVAAVRELAQGEFKANAQRYMDGSFPWDNMKKLAEIGVLGMSVPEEYGGLGLPVFDTALLLEEIAKTCYVTAMATLGEAGVQTRVIATYAPETIRKRILPKVVSGDCMLAVCMTEPHAGTDMPSTPISASFFMFSQGNVPSIHFCALALNSLWARSRTVATIRFCSPVSWKSIACP